MKKKFGFLFIILLFAAATPAFAHDHGGSHESMEHATENNLSAKESEVLLDSCAQKAVSVMRRIDSLRARIDAKHASGSMNEELKKLEQKLLEANDIVRPLQIF